jgi:hypothetical protein
MGFRRPPGYAHVQPSSEGGAVKTTTEFEAWRVTARINKAGNLTLEIDLNGEMHAEVIFQEGGVVDVGGRFTPWPLGEKGWDMPGAPAGFRKFRFEPPQVAATTP